MGLHRLTDIAIGVPNVEETAAYYSEFGLTPSGAGINAGFSTADGGEQLRIPHSPHRRLLSLGVGVDDPDDLDRITASLAGLDITGHRDGSTLHTRGSGHRARRADLGRAAAAPDPDARTGLQRPR